MRSIAAWVGAACKVHMRRGQHEYVTQIRRWGIHKLHSKEEAPANVHSTKVIRILHIWCSRKIVNSKEEGWALPRMGGHVCHACLPLSYINPQSFIDSLVCFFKDEEWL